MKILIMDDERAFSEELRDFVIKICEENHAEVEIELADNVEQLLKNALGFDVILLDIEMPEYSGLELAAKLNAEERSDKPYIVFVTNRDGLVFEALREQPYSFVRKSHLEELEPCLKRLIKLCERGELYTVKSGRAIERLSLGDISYLEKQKNYVIFHTARGEFRERTTLDKKSDLLRRGFLRTHIGYMVNVRYIEKIDTELIRLSDGTLIPLSRRYRADVRRRFFEWMVNLI